MTTSILLPVLVAAVGAAAFFIGRSLGERRGRSEARQDLERISRDAAGQSYEAAREACEKAAGQAVERLRGDAEQHGKAAAQSFAAVAAPLKQSLDEVKRKAEELGRERAADRGSMRQLTENLSRQVEEVRGSARSLRDAMRGDRQARGRWGEMQLENLIRAAGMTEHCDFDRQRRLNGNGGNRGIPDLVVRFPGGGSLAVDAKAPLDAYLDATDPNATPERQAERLRAHARALRGQVDALARRRYPDEMDGPPFTVLFLPMESLLAEAERCDSGLIRDAWSKRVVIATPTTLLALLWSAAASWRDFHGTRRADELRRQALEAGSRLEKFLEHFAGVGTGLAKATDAYNAAVGSGERRLFPQLQRLRELEGGESAGRDSSNRRLPEPVEAVPRPMFGGPTLPPGPTPGEAVLPRPAGPRPAGENPAPRLAPALRDAEPVRRAG